MGSAERNERRARGKPAARWSIDYEEIGAPHVERMLDQAYPVNRDCNRTLNAELDAHALELFDGIDDLRIPVLIVQGAADPRPLGACDELTDASCRSLTGRSAGSCAYQQPARGPDAGTPPGCKGPLCTRAEGEALA